MWINIAGKDDQKKKLYLQSSSVGSSRSMTRAPNSTVALQERTSRFYRSKGKGRMTQTRCRIRQCRNIFSKNVIYSGKYHFRSPNCSEFAFVVPEPHGIWNGKARLVQRPQWPGLDNPPALLQGPPDFAQ